MIDRDEVSRDVTVLRLDHGGVSALDLELLRALRAELAELRAAGRAIVLTGTGSAFSAGVDLLRLVDGGAGYVAEFLPELSGAFDDLFRYPHPVVAAMNGHAVAGGCVLACCADYRMMAEGRGRVGVPELLVGVAFPAVALAAIRSAAGDEAVADLVMTGATHLPEEALRRGLVDELVPAAELVDRAVAKAEHLASLRPVVFSHTKRSLRGRFLTEIEAAGRQRDEEMLAVWRDPATLAAAADYVNKTLGK